jgi:hypothetical protein
MQVYDKLLTEMQNQKVIFFGNLISPNHFRINIDTNSENLFNCMFIIKNHNFSFLTINSTSISEHLEYFFYYHISGRNFLFSIIYNLKSKKNFIINSLSSLFPESTNIEKFIESVSLIKFKNNLK